jgi:hypothetical protein
MVSKIKASIASELKWATRALPARHSKQVTMVMQKYIQRDTNFPQRESPVASAARFAPRIDEPKTISSLTRTQSASVIDFFEARDRLPAGFEGRSKAFEINRKSGKVVVSRYPSIGRMDRFEESLYWFLSAATLIFLLFELL